MAEGQIAEQVAEHLEEAAEVTRQVDTRVLGMFLGGVGLGALLGFYFGYRFNRAKIRAEEIKNAEHEIDLIRQWYQDRAAELPIDLSSSPSVPTKPSLEDVIEERQYGGAEEAALGHAVAEATERPLRPPVPVPTPRQVRAPAPPPVEKSKNDGWDYTTELAGRSPNHPYVIHQDEFKQDEPNYQQVTWTYYAADDILADERDEIVVRPELIVGQANRLPFGHGSDDINVVHVRNDKLEMEFEICRTLKSYEEEVIGLTNDNDG